MENELIAQRRQKLEELKNLGINPFSNDFKPLNESAEILASYGSFTEEQLKDLTREFLLAGRVVAIRDFGKSLFFHLMDRTGKIQGYVRKDVAGEDSLNLFKDYVDVGDFIGIKGTLFKTKTGELTISVKDFQILTKALRPLPEKWHGLKDVETRYRQRYLDLISNPQARDIFVKRTRIIRLLRQFLDDKGFLEVETPILHSVAGGAAARPFKTYHNALDMELFLRIAPELYLKRLVVGGLERVYEIGRMFRNEGVSTQHNPEFTMVELYQAYATYEDLMGLIEELICFITKNLLGTLEFKYGELNINMNRPWKRINIIESLRSQLGEDVLKDEQKLFQKADSLGIAHRGIKGKAMVEIFEHLVGTNIVDPTFVYEFPLDVSPLARKNDQNPEFTDRFELFIAGREIANAFSELNDPIDQNERFVKQLELKARGEEEVHETDKDFITALEHGMPPTAGAGIGIDRLVMLLTNSPSIREVIFFPHLRPE
ncbi:MAG TPA: lysine--tRNA ligase [Thermodesulfobacteriota bacterium]|nr:lysine--tRNA ligase [Thermodesulfobacteriota bacterium]